MPDDLTTPDALEVIDLPAPNDGEDGTLAMEPAANTAIARWYAVQVASSCEKKVKATLEQRAVTLGVSNRILEIEIPQTPAIKLKKDGSRQSTEEKVFPGYVLVRMVLDEDTMMAVRSTPNVINFVGAEDRRATGKARGHIKPRPLSRSEVDRIFKRAAEKKTVVKVDLAEGDQILVTAGPFKDFQGEVIEVCLASATSSRHCCPFLDGKRPLNWSFHRSASRTDMLAAVSLRRAAFGVVFHPAASGPRAW